MTSGRSRVKLAVFWGILLTIPLVVAVLAVQVYYFHGYLTIPVNYCRSFALLDEEIGWILAPNSESCIEGAESETGQPVFSATVFVNGDGARAQSSQATTPTGGLLALGDSWTFGYGIDWKDTFAAQLDDIHGRPTALFASPAYSGAQALLLGRRVVSSVQPTAIIYLELGFWERGVCSGPTRPTRVLKPCYWVDGDGEAYLVTPPAGLVRYAGAFGLRPGGMLGAGEKSLAYFQIARPAAKIDQLLVRLGLKSGFADDFHALSPPAELATIHRTHLANLAALAEAANATLVLIDPGEIYRLHATSNNILYIGRDTWDTEVLEPMRDLQPEQATVPGDGHFGPGTHGLIAAMIDRAMARHCESCLQE